MLTAHVQRTSGVTMSATVNAALADYLEASALKAYRRWAAGAGEDERAALDEFAAHHDESWSSG